MQTQPFSSRSRKDFHFLLHFQEGVLEKMGLRGPSREGRQIGGACRLLLKTSARSHPSLGPDGGPSGAVSTSPALT